MVKPAKVTAYPRCHLPVLCSEQEGLLDHRIIERSGGSGVFPFLPQDPVEPCPYTPILTKICDHHWTVVIRCGKKPTELLELRHRLQGSPICLEGHCCSFPQFLLSQPLKFPLRSLGTQCRVPMIPIQRPPGNKNILFGAAR